MTQPNDTSGVTVDPQSGAPAGEPGQIDPTTQSGGEPGQQTTTQPSGKTFTEAEVEQIRTRMRAADQRASALDAELRQLKDKDLPEIEKLKRDTEEAIKRAQAAEDALVKANVTNAFLANTTYSWHSPDQALALLDRSKIDIDNDGKVTGMEHAVKALADGSPWLLKPKVDDGGQQQQPPGTVPGTGGGTPGGGTPSKAKLGERFTALRGRN